MTKTVVKILHGSHLYGTNTPNSDTDYKTIFIPEAHELIVQKAKKTNRETTGKAHQKNTKDDVDSGFFSLDNYFKLLGEGQTMALDLLFAPDSHILETSPLWKFIQLNKDKLIHKNMTAFVGYCQTQAAKYGIKGSRMAAVKTTIDYLSTLDPNSRLFENWPALVANLSNVEHVAFIKRTANNTADTLVDMLEVCTRVFDRTCKVYYVISCLAKIFDNYGARAKMAMDNEGVDWKALSHAVRVCIQGQELLTTGHMSLPLLQPELDVVRTIKAGKLPYKTVQKIIEDYVALIEESKQRSKLPEELDKQFCDKLITDVYLEHVNSCITPSLDREIAEWLRRG